MSKPLITTTYGKRRRNKKENVPSVKKNYTDKESGNHTRTQVPTENQPQQKKRKISAEGVDNKENMALQPFQTPFPTLQAQSQIFKLPSSRPQDTPGILSPVPVSSGLKEYKTKKRSSASKSSWFSGNIADSTTLTSGAFNFTEETRPTSVSRSQRRRADLTGRGSRSSSNSSRISGQGHTSKRVIKHIQSLSSLGIDSKPKKKGKQKSSKNKPKSTSSSKHVENYLPLASPFISRASSPVEFNQNDDVNAHIPTLDLQKTGRKLMGPPLDPTSNQASNARRILTDTKYNPNLPHVLAHSRASREVGPGYKSQSAKTSPTKKDINDFLKTNTRPLRPSSRNENRRQAPANTLSNVLQHYERERRPSAPSSLHIARPSRDLCLRNSLLPGANPGGDLDGAAPPSGRTRHCLASGLNIVLGPPPIVDSIAPKPLLHSVAKDPAASMDWMHTRVRVDFNRPPSQMSIGGNGFGEGYGFPYPENGAGDVFFSSSSEGEDNGGYKDNNYSEDECDNEDAAAADCDDRQSRRGVRKLRNIAPSPFVSINRSRRISDLNLHDLEADMANFGDDIWCISTPATKNAAGLADKNHAALGLQTGRKIETDVIKAKMQTVALDRSSSLPDLRRREMENSSSIGLGSGPAVPVWARRFSAAPNYMHDDEDGDDEDGDDEDEDEQEDEKEDEDEEEDGEMDMELTGDAVEPKIKSGLLLDNEAQISYGGIGEKDDTPWITDSIISPPTVYLQRKSGKSACGTDDVAYSDKGKVGEGGSGNEQVIARDEAPRLESPFMLSDVGEENGSSSSADTLRALQDMTLLSQNRSQSKDAIQPNGEPVLVSGNTKRTRSGTIVPAGGAPALSHARRTRSGTIVGPLSDAPTGPLPSIPGPKRTRSGTIVAPAPAAVAGHSSPPPSCGGRARRGSVLRFNEKNLPSLVATAQPPISDVIDNNLKTAFDVNDVYTPEDPDLEYYTDCLYIPKLTSSPDPIDFLRCASIEEGDEDLEPIGFAEPEEIIKDIVWRVAEDPPSPQIVKKRGQGTSGLFKGRAFCGKTWGLNKKSLFGNKGKKKARFVDGDDDQQVAGDADSGGKQFAEEEELSDDELLLLPGTTINLWS